MAVVADCVCLPIRVCRAKGPIVPEHVLKKRKTLEAIQADRTKKLAEERAKNKVQRGVIFKKAAAYAKEYKQKEADLIRFRREAKKHNNFFMEPETKVVFVVRIRGINAVDPKSRKILQLMRLRQVCFGLPLLPHTPRLGTRCIGRMQVHGRGAEWKLGEEQDITGEQQSCDTRVHGICCRKRGCLGAAEQWEGGKCRPRAGAW